MNRFNDDKIKNALANSERIAVKEWDMHAIESRIHSEQIYKMVLLDDESLYVFYHSVLAGGKHNNMGVTSHFIVAPSYPSYKRFLEISGLSKSSDEICFPKPQASK